MTPLQVLPALRTPSEQPADLLLECHGRIRRFSGLAVRIASLVEAPPQERADAARSVHRYFGVAMPLHVQDEDLTLRPLLLADAPAAVGKALDAMTREHDEIEAALAELLPRWRMMAETPEGEVAFSPLLASSTALEQLLASHLAAEEAVVLPAVRALPPALQAQILREMRGRRVVSQS